MKWFNTTFENSEMRKPLPELLLKHCAEEYFHSIEIQTKQDIEAEKAVHLKTHISYNQGKKSPLHIS